MLSSRSRKSGDAAHFEMKLESKYDEQEANGTPQRVMEWLNRAMEGEVEPCVNNSWQDIQVYLKDGVVLCKFINMLLDTIDAPKIKYKTKANMAFVAMANIEAFNKGASDYGVPTTALFQTTDLFDGRKSGMLNVINCLNQLGFTANNKGYQPDYRAVEAPKAKC